MSRPTRGRKVRTLFLVHPQDLASPKAVTGLSLLWFNCNDTNASISVNSRSTGNSFAASLLIGTHGDTFADRFLSCLRFPSAINQARIGPYPQGPPPGLVKGSFFTGCPPSRLVDMLVTVHQKMSLSFFVLGGSHGSAWGPIRKFSGSRSNRNREPFGPLRFFRTLHIRSNLVSSSKTVSRAV